MTKTQLKIIERNAEIEAIRDTITYMPRDANGNARRRDRILELLTENIYDRLDEQIELLNKISAKLDA